MKKLLLLFFTICFFYVHSFGQSRFISASPFEEMDEIADLNGDGGVLLFSKNGNLTANVTNASNAKISPLGKRNDGYYVYSIIVNAEQTPQPKIEVSRRGDINRTNFVVPIRQNFYRAYLVEEVEKPIHLEDQTASNDAYLDPNGAELEFSTAIEGLKIEISPKLESKIEKKSKPNDREIFITSLKIPLAKIEATRNELEKTIKEFESLDKQLQENPSQYSDRDWVKLDQLGEKCDKLEQEFKELTTITVFADGTNKLTVNIDDLKPRMKKVYGVLLLNKVQTVYVTESSAALAEGSRLYTLRNYQEAKNNFEKALNSEDVNPEDKSMLLANIAECDTCIKIENRLKYVLLKLNDLRKQEASQSEVVKYANFAIGDFTALNNYNPHEFYSGRIQKLQEIIEDQPLSIHFTVSKWINDYSGFYEKGRIPNVEIWAYYGNNIPTPKQYSNEKSFKKLVESSRDFQLIGVTDNQGEIDIDLNRKEKLPSGFIFFPIKQKDYTTPQYLDLKDALKTNVDEYNKHQYRLKMYSRQ